MNDPRWITFVRHMQRGEFELAWQISDTVLRERVEKPSCDWSCQASCLWNGTPLDGKRVLIRCHHGLGDTIQFIRYAEILERRAAEVAVWVQMRLVPLLKGVSGIHRIMPLEDGPPGYEQDIDVEVMELPYIFRTTIDTIPAAVPYIEVDAAPRRNENFAVGVVWKGGPWDRRRDIPFPLITTLTSVPQVVFYSLQQDAAADERHIRLAQVVDADSDALATARIMRSLDLVITVDSMPAHLAGALGVPTWTLLHSDPDWRWMDGDYSPWYPTMRLFRQAVPGDWTPVIANIVAELTRLSRTGRNCSMPTAEADRGFPS